MATKKDKIKDPKTVVKLTARITEKASNATALNIYTFDLLSPLNKTEVKKEISKIYKVRPVKVNILSVPAKRVSWRGKPGKQGEGRKAFVYLKVGDKIEFA